MVRCFLLVLSFFWFLWGVTLYAQCNPSDPVVEERVADIDDEILDLEEKKRGYDAAVLRHEDQAERLQYEERNYLESRRHVELAEENRAMSKRLEAEIRRLKDERMRILRECGAETLPPPGGDGFKDL